MIRFEIEIEERNPGKIDIFCRAFEGCWCDSTPCERSTADEIVSMMRPGIESVAKHFGNVETFEGDAAERVRREGRL